MCAVVTRHNSNLTGLIFTIALMLATVSFPWPVFAESRELQAQNFVHEGINNVLVVLKDRKLDRQSKLSGLRRVLRHHFDHRTIGRFAAGVHYRRASAAEQKRYLSVLEDFVINTYGRRMITYSRQINKDLKASDLFKVMGVTSVGKRDFLVRTHVNRRTLEPVTIDWRVRRRKNGFAVVDVVIMGISQIITYRSEFTAVIYRQKKGLAGLTESLVAKNAKLTSEKQ